MSRKRVECRKGRAGVQEEGGKAGGFEREEGGGGGRDGG
jgi:hypothetical protein